MKLNEEGKIKQTKVDEKKQKKKKWIKDSES